MGPGNHPQVLIQLSGTHFTVLRPRFGEYRIVLRNGEGGDPLGEARGIKG